MKPATLQNNLSFPSKLDWSAISTYDACPHKWWLQYHNHVIPLEQRIDLHAGGAIARGLEVTRYALWEKNLNLDTALCEGTRAFNQYWGDYDAPDDANKSYQNMLGALWEYFREYPPITDPIKVYRYDNGKPAIEFSFAIPTNIGHPQTGEPILLCGRFDMLGFYNGILAIIDEKTTKQLGGRWVQQWNLRGQFLCYTYAARSHGLPVDMVVIRGLGILKNKYTHLQAIEQYPNYLLKRWWVACNGKIQSMVNDWKTQYWPQSFADACSSYGGCDYKQLCSSPDAKTWLGNFQHYEWNPLALKEETK